MTSLTSQFAHAMQRFSSSLPPTFAVAVSGGADSVALLHLLKDWCAEHRHKLIALTVDHGIRLEAADEAKQVAKWCTMLGVEHHILTYQGDALTSNIQARAREIRYALMQAWCVQNKIKHVCVAHHKQDQAETVMLRLMRGSGIDGLGGMKEVSRRKGIILLRPLLKCTPTQLKTYLEQQGRSYIDDPSNADSRYARIEVREFLLSLARSSEVVEHIATSAQNAQRAQAYVKQQAEIVYKEVVQHYAQGYATCNREILKTQHSEIALRLLKTILEAIAGGNANIRHEELMRLFHAVVEGKEKAATLHGCVVRRGRKKTDADMLYFFREYKPMQQEKAAEPEGVFDGRFRYRWKEYKPLHSVKALGEQGWLQLKGVIALDPAVPKEALYTLPALWHLEKVVAAPHINYAANEEYRGFDIVVLKN